MLAICDHFFQPDTRSPLLKNGNITTKIMIKWTVLGGAWESDAWVKVVAPLTQSEALYSMLCFPNLISDFTHRHYIKKYTAKWNILPALFVWSVLLVATTKRLKSKR
jgi:hypothetical protein